MSPVFPRGQTHALKLLKNGTGTVGISGIHYDWCVEFNYFEPQTYFHSTLFFRKMVWGFSRQPMPDADCVFLVQWDILRRHRDGRLVSRIQTAYVIWGMLHWCGCLMTTLDQLRKNHISIECKCGYSVLLPITDLLNHVRPETTLERVSQIARCSRCKRKGEIDFRLHYVCRVWALSSS